MGELGKTVYDYKDAVKAAGEGEEDDVVPGDGRPGARWNGQRLKVPVRGVAGTFCALTCVARADVVVDERAHAWEVEVAGEELESLLLAEMTCSETVVGLLEELDLDWLDIWDVDKTLVKKESVFVEGKGG